MAITRAQQYRQMLKNGKVAMQGGVKNYLGKKKMVTVPKNWQSGPDHPKTELAYITKAEKDLLIKKNLHNSLNGRPNRGPAGVMSLNGWGDKGDTSDRSYGGGNVSGSGDNKDYSGYKDTGTGNYQKNTNQADIDARIEYEKAKKERERQEKIQEEVNRYNQKKVEKLKSFVNKDILDLVSEDELDDVDVTDKGIFGKLNDIRTDLSRKTLVNSIAQKLGAMPKSYVPSVFMSDMMRSTPKGITTDSLTDMLSSDFDMGLYGISGKDLTKAQQQLDVAKQDTISQSDFDSVYGNKPPEERGDGGNNQVYIPPVVSSVVEPEEEIDPNSLQGLLANRIAYRFMADGGRAAYQDGSPAVDPRMARSLQENVAANEAQRASNQSFKDTIVQRMQNAQNAPSASQTLGRLYNKEGINEAESNFLLKASELDPQIYEKTGTGFLSDLRHKTAAAQLRDNLGGGIMGKIAANALGGIREVPQLLTGDFKGVAEDIKANYLGAENIPVGLTPQESYDYLIAQQQVDPGVATTPIEQSSVIGNETYMYGPDGNMYEVGSGVATTPSIDQSGVIPGFTKLRSQYYNPDGTLNQEKFKAANFVAGMTPNEFEYKDTRTGDIYGPSTYASIAAGMYPNIYKPGMANGGLATMFSEKR